MVLVSFSLSLGLSGCGYMLRGNARPFFETHHIHTLYVPPVKNNSYKAGIEITVYNALRRRFAQGGYVTLVDSARNADAEIDATVTDATYSPSGITTTDQLAPIGTGPSQVQIASTYNVSLKVRFELVDAKKSSLWKDEVSRGKSFPATTYLGALGSTSALINESEFERALGDLSVSIVTDAEESINTIF